MRLWEEGASAPSFPRWQVEPQKSWHGREGVLLARGVIRFDGESSPTYHLIDMNYVRPLD